jgi:hypothetical protein
VVHVCVLVRVIQINLSKALAKSEKFAIFSSLKSIIFIRIKEDEKLGVKVSRQNYDK